MPFVCFVRTVCAAAYQFRGAGKHATHARASHAAAAAAAAIVLHAARHRLGSDPNEAADEAAAVAEQS